MSIHRYQAPASLPGKETSTILMVCRTLQYITAHLSRVEFAFKPIAVDTS